MYTKLTSIILLSMISNLMISQNLLNTSTWTIGTGSVPGFTVYGSQSENSRELGLNHIGEEVIIWKASPDGSNDADGGWVTTWLNIDKTKTYRFSVWIKKTNSNDGVTSFGCDKYNSVQILNLNNTNITNPHFWKGDLPILNRWYLLVGFVHSEDYLNNIHLGKIYDGVIGEPVINMIDFKFNGNATTTRLRAFLDNDTNTSDNQYFYAPRIEEVNGLEWPINKLLSINPDSELVFVYDNAGNQIRWFYALPDWYKVNPSKNKENLITSEVLDEDESSLLDKNIVLYPNPTKGIVTIKLSSDSEVTFSTSINIYNSIGIQVITIPVESRKDINIDLSDLSNGLYIIHMSLSDGSNVAKQIIKK